MPLQMPFKNVGIFPGKKCPTSSARNLLLAGEPSSRFWNGAEGVKGGGLKQIQKFPTAFSCG